MSFQSNKTDRIAYLWGSSWQKLTLKQKQLVSETLNNLKITNISEQIEEKAGRMPLPDFEEVSETDNYFVEDELESRNLTLSWQLVLAKLSEALINKNFTQIIALLFLESNYTKIHTNAMEDTCSILRNSFSTIPFYASNIIEIERKIELIKELIKAYIGGSQNKNYYRDRAIDELGNIISELSILEVYGLGAFMIAATLQLLLMQETATPTDLLKLKSQTLEYINYAKVVNPRLFRLSLGKIDKSCKCIKYNSQRENQSEYECRYCDGRDIHIFRDKSDRVGYECNKHRLKMFHSVAQNVNQTVSQPVRSAIKKWQEFMVSLPSTSP